tara:strand:- start:5379 stop:6092 length:714 start_codon:yes stop_codon:yes gene_type:complete
LAKNYAYIRISDGHKQDSKGQRDKITRYAEQHGLFIYKWYEYTLSGSQTDKAQRGLVDLIERLAPGDRVLVNDIERLGRDSISDIMEVTTRIINAGAELHFCLTGDTLTPSHKNDIGQFFIQIGQAFAAQDFSKQRSRKAKAAAKRRQEQGLPAGRAKGAIIKSKLDTTENQILFWLSQDVFKSEIARRLGVSSTALIKWLDRRDELICQARERGLYENGLSISEIKARLKRKNPKN